MAIEGPLRELGIHDVFQLLDLSRKTGALRVTPELRHNEGKIYFDNGVVVSAEIRSNPHPLGALLLRTGKIAEADLERARDMQQRQGDKRRLGEILVSLGVITQSDTRISPSRRLSPWRCCMSRARSRSASAILPVRSSNAPRGWGLLRISADTTTPLSK